MKNRQFPVLTGGDNYPGAPGWVPWDLLAGHEAMALSNHGQTLERLADRGGLSPDEMLSIIHDVPYRTYWAGKSREQIILESAKQLIELLAAAPGRMALDEALRRSAAVGERQ